MSGDVGTRRPGSGEVGRPGDGLPIHPLTSAKCFTVFLQLTFPGCTWTGLREVNEDSGSRGANVPRPSRLNVGSVNPTQRQTLMRGIVAEPRWVTMTESDCLWGQRDRAGVAGSERQAQALLPLRARGRCGF